MARPRARAAVAVAVALAVALALGGAVTAAAVAHREAEPQFEASPVAIIDTGRGHIENLKENAAKEGFFNKMFGTDCWSQALGVVERQCKRLSSEQQARLAVALFNCHMRQAGRFTVKCPAESSIKDCTGHMDDKDFIIYSNFVQHVESMCLFIQAQDFNAHTEALINTLHGATADAAESLASVASNLSAQEASLREIDTTLSGIEASQSSVAAGVAEALAGVQHLEERSEVVTERLAASLTQGDKLLRQQADVRAGLAALEAAEREAAEAALHQWRDAEERAHVLAAAQEQYIEQQNRMLQETRSLSEDTAGIRSAMDVVLDYERRSDRLMLLMLGRSYTLEDVLFYGGALAVGLLATAPRPTRGARLPGLVLLASTLVAERLAVSSSSALLEADASGNIMLLLPSAAALVAFATSGNTAHIFGPELEFTAVNYKTLVRRVWLTAGAALLVHCYFAYRNYERENHALLRRMEAELGSTRAALLESLAGMQARLDAQHAALRRELLADVDGLLLNHPALSPNAARLGGTPPAGTQGAPPPTEPPGLDVVPTCSPGRAPGAAPLPFLRRLLSGNLSAAASRPTSPAAQAAQAARAGGQLGELVMSSPAPAPYVGSTAPYAPLVTAPTGLSTIQVVSPHQASPQGHDPRQGAPPERPPAAAPVVEPAAQPAQPPPGGKRKARGKSDDGPAKALRASTPAAIAGNADTPLKPAAPAQPAEPLAPTASLSPGAPAGRKRSRAGSGQPEAGGRALRSRRSSAVSVDP